MKKHLLLIDENSRGIIGYKAKAIDHQFFTV